MFSSRSGFDLHPNRLAAVLAEKRAAGDTLIDLTRSNPTTCGFATLRDGALTTRTALGDARELVYEPAPRGLASAREAVSRYYAERGVSVAPERVVLTASTSEAYSYLFKLLADPGDSFLAPMPSYPLFGYLASLEGVALHGYRLDYEGAWRLDLDSVRAATHPTSRAILTVSPNNPTGSCFTVDDLLLLDSLAARDGMAVVSDEVFSDYPFDPAFHPPVAAAHASHALTFTLSGLSKVCGLPQVKLGWIVVAGPDAAVHVALERLELIADTFLSVSTPVQVAAPRLLAARAAFQHECRERTRRNRAALARAASHRGAVQLLTADGGWTACLRVPRLGGEEDFVLELLREDGVVVHPGYFFDFASEAYVVLSLIVPEAEFDAGVARLFARLE